ncbi:sulfatase domain-containingprotein [Purpureocillium lavendulum]|uniref:Sulfatase domain-containingprotein n=1 Tax=Purpureocillium lavendulum TaxID=1247861 RepID=A0AB34G3H3_9HYPO|nr:sulfatase domain-containingprotein [Purpureocillium lavendulum]
MSVLRRCWPGMHPTFVCFIFAVFCVSVLVTKALRLSQNAHSFNVVAYFIYLPVLLVPDLLLICAEWLLLRRKNGILLSVLGITAACLISATTLFAATSQLSFWWQTGGDIEWADAAAFALHDEGRKVLMSGSSTALAIGSAIAVVAWITKGLLSRFISAFVAGVEARIFACTFNRLATLYQLLRWAAVKFGLTKPVKGGGDEHSLLPMREMYHNDSDSDLDDDASSDRTLTVGDGNLPPEHPTTRRRVVSYFVAGAFMLVFMTSALIFDPDRPYGRVLTTLPLPLLDVFKSKTINCDGSTWPLPDLVDKSLWERPNGDYKGWAPAGADNRFIRKYRERKPDWLPASLPSGFGRWDPEERRKGMEAANSAPSETEAEVPASISAPARDHRCPEPVIEDPFYNPVNDPMKISNLDSDILQPLQKALQGVKIRHVALIQMESMREELFPLQHGSDFHKLLMKSHEEGDLDEANARFANMTINTERLTGKLGNFQTVAGDALTGVSPEWNDKTDEGFGGINIVGAHTTSSVSTKSTAAIHCGLWPMPVDMFEESQLPNYQPCLPQLLELFNRMKGNSSNKDFRDYQWYPAFFQSVTDGYDRQDQFDDRIGFKYIVTKKRLKSDSFSNPDLEEINYFGYPETALKDYIRDYVTNATANNKRMFLSHFTSTTHHPWATPKGFDTLDYMGAAHGGLTDFHKDMNKYLNTIRWTDAWLGNLMKILDETGVANETLVVFVGDHGQAFKEDHKKTGTYENGHISNFRVPITFRHPKIPRVQHHVNSTSISILPTILDLLINTDSLSDKDRSAASDLIQDYEGQSLIRPYKVTHRGRRSWNFGVVNPGGRILTVTSADAPWRLVMPLDGKTEYKFTDLARDPMELHRREKWSIKGLVSDVRRHHGEDAAAWLTEANSVAQWWGAERKRLWQYEESE